MKLYEVTNGWLGESYVKVFVIAENEERAIYLATIAFQKDSIKEDHNWLNDTYTYSLGNTEKYWTDLKARCLHKDTSKEYSSTSRDY